MMCLSIELEFFAKQVLFIGIDIVIEQIKEPGDAVGRYYDSGPCCRCLLGDLKIPTTRILLEVEVEELVFHLQGFAHQFDVVSTSSSTTNTT